MGSKLVGMDFSPKVKDFDHRGLIMLPLRGTLTIRWILSRVGLILTYHMPLITIMRIKSICGIRTVRFLHLPTLDMK